MLQENGGDARLDEVFWRIAQTAPSLQALLARHFPAAGGCLYPDAAGNVCVAAGGGAASDRPASIYARCVAKLGPLVAAFSAAAVDQAAVACIRIARERNVFACALDLARHPLDPMQRQLFMARMMPEPARRHRQDDATASCIWLRLWTLHAWVLELRLVIALSGGAATRDQADLEALDRGLSALLRPDAHWLSVDLGTAAPAEMVARAPLEVLAVGRLAWPNRLGAMLPDDEMCPGSLRRRGIGSGEVDGKAWLTFRGRFAELPSSKPGHARPRRGVRLNA